MQGSEIREISPVGTEINFTNWAEMIYETDEFRVLDERVME